jgi:vitamin B12 transporter
MSRAKRRWIGILLILGAGWLSQPVTGEEVEVGKVVVTATKTEVEISESPQSISVVSQAEIMNTPDRSLGSILQRVPGVMVTENGPVGSISTPAIRGSTSGQVLILINGRRINDAQNGQFDLNNLPVAKEEIDHIEVLRGAASALYGADALGGVINIITKKPSSKPDTSVSASYGRFDTQQYSLTHRWKPGAFLYGVSLTRERSSGYRENSDYDAWILGGEVGYEISPQTEMMFSARTIKKEIGLPGTITFPDPDDRQKDEITLLDLNIKSQPISSLNLNVKGFYNNYRNTFEAGTQGALSMGGSALHKSSATGAELQATYALLEKHLITGGLEGIEDRADSSSFGVKEATRGAIYLQDEIEMAPFLMTLGARYDYHSIYEEQFNPRIGMVLRLPQDLFLRASIARSFRAPTFNDLYWPASAYTAGNPDLQPEKAWAYEIGAEKKFGHFAVIKAAGFYRDVQDLINWAAGSDGVWRPSNVSSAKIWGAEGEVIFYPFKGLAIPLNYSFLYPRDEATGEPIPAKPKHMANIGIEYTSSFGLKPSLKGRYVQFYVNDSSTLNRDYFVLDARVGYDFKIHGYLSGEAFISLTNALDEEYQTIEGYPMPPRSLNGGISITF